MESLLGELYGGFGDDGLVWYGFMSELVANNNVYVLIDTYGLI